MPNRTGLFDDAIVKRLAVVGKAWSADTTRARMPSAPPRIDRPFTRIFAPNHVLPGSRSCLKLFQKVERFLLSQYYNKSGFFLKCYIIIIGNPN